jgi:IPT/TIG domain.
MRRAIVTAVAVMFMAIGATAQNTVEERHQVMSASPMSQEEHLAHLREFLASNSTHGPVIPQPASVIIPLATQSFTVTARSFSFTIAPSSFVVNQGDVVNLTLTVPSNDPSTVGHGILMETYVENGFDCPRGQTKQFQFTATTAGTFAFVCDIPDCGTGHSSMFGTFKVNAVVNPAPTVSAVSPVTGSQAGGTVTTITGTGFLANATVKFGGTSATNVTVVSATSITATAPAHGAGAVDVVVTNTDTKAATLAQAFTYAVPGPTISTIAPATGPTTGGTLITITGTGFLTGATVKIGALPATDVTVVSATSITARTPLGPATEQLSTDVVVTNPDATKATATGAFTYSVPALTVISVTPNTTVPIGTSGAGPVVVTIFGAGFTTALNTSVTVGGIAATNVQVIDAVTIRATFPTHAAGSADVVVTGGTSATLKNGFSWQNAPSKHRATKG